MPKITPPRTGGRILDSGWSWAIGSLFILALAFVLRLLLSDSQSLTMDELFDLDTARSGWQGVLTAENRFPPLYHWALLGWWQWASADITGRLFSVCCGTILVGIVGLLGREIGGRATGWWSSLLCAISPFAVWYSLESRVYSLYLLLAALTLWQFALVIRHGQPRHWFWFGVASLAGAYTHYYFALLLVSSVLVFCWLKRSERQSLRSGLLVFAVLGLLCLPDLWFLREDLDQRWGYARTSKFSLSALGYTFFSFFSGYSLGPSLRELHQLGGRAAITQVAPWLLLLGLPVAILSCLGVWQRKQEQGLPAALFLGAFGIAPILFVGLTSQFASFGYNVRHALWCYLPLQVIVARGIAWGRPRWLTTACTLLLCSSSLVAIWNHHCLDRYRHEDLRSAARFLSAQADPDSPIFVLSGYMAEPLNYFLAAELLPEGRSAIPLDTDHGKTGPADTDPGSSVLSSIRDHAGNHGTIMLVYTREFHGDPQGKVLQAIRQVYDLQAVASLAGVQIYRGSKLTSTIQ